MILNMAKCTAILRTIYSLICEISLESIILILHFDITAAATLFAGDFPSSVTSAALASGPTVSVTTASRAGHISGSVAPGTHTGINNSHKKLLLSHLPALGCPLITGTTLLLGVILTARPFPDGFQAHHPCPIPVRSSYDHLLSGLRPR